ncbi:MAG: methionine--tRNA ligase [Patescibacteria group bacterium]|nr:methionine--tRNA ligase [Patescibacteria group bacterium]
MNNFYITTTLPYVNSPLHMGHALEFIRADVIARYKKSLGYDVFFNTGTDEHGMKIYEKDKENTQNFVDQAFKTFKEQLEIFNLDKDIHFIRTSDENHIKSAQEFWKRVYDNGYIYKKNYEARYCIGCESEKVDSDLVDGDCPEHPGEKLTIINEENYFFKYSAFQEKLLDFYKKNPDFVVPAFRFNEIKIFIKKGLKDFSISRLKSKMPWGIPVPGDEDQVMYVWFDALINYISTLDWPQNGNYDKYWVNGETVQYCGKDNLRFQAAMWQAMLMAANLPNTNKIIINGFITADKGLRMSKTLGNIVDPRDVVKDYGTDALRYFLLREVSNFEDSPFTLERFKEAYNSGLANGLGNLVARTIKMASNYDAFPEEFKRENNLNLDNFELKNAMDMIWKKISEVDKRIQAEKPFKEIKTNPEKAKQNVSEYINNVYNIASDLTIFLPETSQKIFKALKEKELKENLFPRHA